MGTSVPDTTVSPQHAKLELTGITTIFNSVSGFSVQLDVQALPTAAAATGDPDYSYRMSGLPQYGDLQCEAQLKTTDTALFAWWDEIALGKLTPKDGTLTLMGPTGTPQAAFTITGALMSTLEISAHGLDNPTYATVSVTLNCLSYERTK
jgi:hypothetical protein